MKHRHTPKVHFHFYFKVRNSLITAEKFQKQKKNKNLAIYWREQSTGEFWWNLLMLHFFV